MRGFLFKFLELRAAVFRLLHPRMKQNKLTQLLGQLFHFNGGRAFLV
ncbi:MAG: hypothetical protein JWQ79_2193 [Mucilaginibacter sp.]|nr:hypothetical protein [Mucilaginibacter sp.]